MGYLFVVDPVFTAYVQDEYGLSESYAGKTHLPLRAILGVMFSVPYIAFTLAYVIAPFVVGKVSHRSVIFLCLLITSICVLLFYGPSMILQMPKLVTLLTLLLGVTCLWLLA